VAAGSHPAGNPACQHVAGARSQRHPDYLHVVALADRLGEDAAADVLLGLDNYYADRLGEGGMRVSTQVAKQLAEPRPYDLDSVDLEQLPPAHAAMAAVDQRRRRQPSPGQRDARPVFRARC